MLRLTLCEGCAEESSAAEREAAAAMADVPVLVHVLAAAAPAGLLAAFFSVSLFACHVAAMAFTFLLLVPEGLILASRAYRSKARARLIALHYRLQLAAVALALSGFVAIYLQRRQVAKPHFDTWHGRLGVATLLGTELVASAGLLLYFGIPKPQRHKYPGLVAAHRIAGKLMYVLAAATILTALQVFNPHHHRHKGWITYVLAAAIAAQVAGMYGVLWPLLPRQKAMLPAGTAAPLPARAATSAEAAPRNDVSVSM